MAEVEHVFTLPRLGLVATDEVRIEGLRAILGDAAGGGCGWELVLLSEPGALETAQLEVVLVDASATGHLLELLKNFRRLRPQVRVLVLGGDDDPGFAEEAIGVGARGVLSDAAPAEHVRLAVEAVGKGSLWAPREVLVRMLDRALNRVVEPVAGLRKVHLTRREQAVLALLTEGRSNREIARELGVEETSAKAHVGRLMRKAGVKTRTALGVHAIAEKWL